jgi:methylthioribose-1-phosphate isomerase
MEPFRLQGDTLLLLDQTALPREERWLTIRSAAEIEEAIRTLRVRGAPAIGIAGALGIYLEAMRVAEGVPASASSRAPSRTDSLRAAGERIRAARPTAANLAWAVSRAMEAAVRAGDAAEPRAWAEAVRAEALLIWEEDRACSRAMVRWGRELLPTERRFLTHCHTGGLATGGGGTALGVLVGIHRSGRPIHVWATETRPLLQGARLTAWELRREGIPVRLLADSAAAHVMERSRIEAVLVGADRIARNGDVANKIGTRSLALAARDLGIPFIAVAPTSSVDLACASGEAIPIEERDSNEVLGCQGIPTAPDGVSAENPAFDVTPSRLVTAIVTERGVHRGPAFDLAGGPWAAGLGRGGVDTGARCR